MEQGRDLSAQILHCHRERHPAAVSVIDGFQAALHRLNRFDVRVPNPFRSNVPPNLFVRRADQPSQGDLASDGRSRHGDQELTAVQPAPPQFDQRFYGVVEVICPVEADLCLLEAYHAATGRAMVDEVVPRDTGDSLDADGVIAADAALPGFPLADVAAADAKGAASAVPVLPVLDLVGEVIL